MRSRSKLRSMLRSRDRLVPHRIGHAEHVMGTVVSFDVSTDGDQVSARSAIGRAVDWLHRVDAVFSTYRADSQINRLGRGELRLDECDGDVAEVLQTCAEIGGISRGYFSSTYGGQLDPTGFVKGWAVQRASEMLASSGFTAHAVNGGGDIQARGEPEPGRPWNTAISHPLRPGSFAGVVAIRDGAIATSGTTERGAHVLDPFTGARVTDLVSVTVIGAELQYADAYATAALAMGHRSRDWLEFIDGYEGFAIAADGSGWKTTGYERVGVLLV
jgi:FAD:protein FMN transferase